MRTTTNNGITFKYPDELAFAFNPAIIIATGAGLNKMRIVVRYNSKKQSAEYDAFNTVCYVDIRGFLQYFFETSNLNLEYANDVQDTNICLSDVTLTIAAYNSTGAAIATVMTSLNVVWGALTYGETYNGFRVGKMWREFPYMLCVYSSPNGKIIVAPDGVMKKIVEMPDAPGVYAIPLTMYAKNFYDIYDFNGNIKQATFSNRFDLTFSNVAEGTYTHKMRINVGSNEYSNGVYLRWVDRHGFWQHYLFQGGSVKSSVTSDSDIIKNNLIAYDQTYGYQNINGRRQSYNRTDTQEICAPLVDSDTLNMLMDLPTSPIVDMYVNGGWVSVTIKAGTYTHSNEVLQDFVCNVESQDFYLQSF